MKAIKNIAAAAEDPDDKLRDRMYDDIDRVIVFDNFALGDLAKRQGWGSTQ